jgi:hypothetical protein
MTVEGLNKCARLQISAVFHVVLADARAIIATGYEAYYRNPQRRQVRLAKATITSQVIRQLELNAQEHTKAW